MKDKKIVGADLVRLDYVYHILDACPVGANTYFDLILDPIFRELP